MLRMYELSVFMIEVQYAEGCLNVDLSFVYLSWMVG